MLLLFRHFNKLLIRFAKIIRVSSLTHILSGIKNITITWHFGPRTHCRTDNIPMGMDKNKECISVIFSAVVGVDDIELISTPEFKVARLWGGIVSHKHEFI